MTVSVLMTVYNGGKYLRQALDSVLGQTCRDFEFLMVDDGSTDGSRAVLESCRDPRVRIMCNPSNMGQTRSLNIGLRAAKGTFVARMDADDVALPSWLETLVAFAQRRPACAVWSAWAYVIDADGHIQRLLKVPATRDRILLRSMTASPINHGGCLMRRDVILAQGGYPEEFAVVADYELWSRLLRSGQQLAVLPEPLTAIRFHGGSISVSKKYDVVARETIRVLQANILMLTGRDLTPSQLNLLWRVLWDEENIDDRTFQDGRILLTQIFGAMRDVWNISTLELSAYARGVIKAVDGKRVRVLIGQGDLAAFYRSMKSVGAAYPFGRVFIVLRLAAIFGLPGLRCLNAVFELSRWLEAVSRIFPKQNFFRYRGQGL